MKGQDKAHNLDHFLGSVMGTFVGDALGEPVEGWPHKAIQNAFGLLDTMVQGIGRYTDDTQMMIGILETLLENKGFDPTVCAKKFLENFDPGRGYGRRIFGVMERIKDGLPWDQVGTDSFGNGGAMRIAPIGCFYATDLDAVKAQTMRCTRITHSHPEGLAGAVAQATAVALAYQYGQSGLSIDTNAMVDRIVDHVSDMDRDFANALTGLKAIERTTTMNLIQALAAQYTLSLKAIDSVPAALGAFLLTDTFKEAVVLAVNLGGDTDTIGAMAGAVAGAYYGFAQIPSLWLESLENGVKGRDYVVNCVKALVCE